jgi:hypothetical protein
MPDKLSYQAFSSLGNPVLGRTLFFPWRPTDLGVFAHPPEKCGRIFVNYLMTPHSQPFEVKVI